MIYFPQTRGNFSTYCVSFLLEAWKEVGRILYEIEPQLAPQLYVNRSNRGLIANATHSVLLGRFPPPLLESLLPPSFLLIPRPKCKKNYFPLSETFKLLFLGCQYGDTVSLTVTATLLKKNSFTGVF